MTFAEKKGRRENVLLRKGGNEMATMEAMVEAVKTHSRENWGKDGWDYIYECWSREEIHDKLNEAGAVTEKQAIRHFKEIAALWDERRREVESFIF